MAELILTDVDERVVHSLRERAASHGRSGAEEEAKAILADALHARPHESWSHVDAIFQRLTASGQNFSDSAELLREDRDR